jgi:hypothetical protein
MKTFGNIETQELISLAVDERDQPIYSRPNNAGEDWEQPKLVPLVKLPMPAITAKQKAQPKLVWHDDRVERDWDIIDKTQAEIAADSRKIWADKSKFWNEFTPTEKAAILTSEHGGIKVLHSDLTMWPGEVWSDDSRIQQGLSGLAAVGILTESRKSQILTK